MLLIPTTIAPSPIHGLGLFTDQPLAPGTVVWKFHPLIDVQFTPGQAEALPPICREKVTHRWGYLHKSGVYILCTDGSQFINHSTQPNLIEIDNESDGNIMVAARTIAAGEELTCDYTTFGEIERAEGLGFQAA